jgi:hypothetical protein
MELGRNTPSRKGENSDYQLNIEEKLYTWKGSIIF